MTAKLKLLLLQTRHIESISYLSAEIVNALPQDKYEVTLVYLESGEPSATDSCAHQCIFLGLTNQDYKGLRLKAIRKLTLFFQENHFDIIIANMYKPINLLMQLRHTIKATLCVGIIHTFGEFDRLGRRWMMRWMIDSRWRIVAVSQALRDYLIAANCGMNAENTSAINNAIDIEWIKAQALDAVHARAALKLPTQGMVFGTLGRSVKGKRQLELIKAFHQFVANDQENSQQDVYLVIIGDGELHQEMCDYVAAHQLENKVYLVGYLPLGLRYLKALDVFVFPSESEGFGMALLEAMALSLPAIVNAVEPLETIVADTNLVVDTADIHALAKAIELYYQLPKEELNKRGADNYQAVVQNYHVNLYRSAYLNFIEHSYTSMSQ
jgi:glycosyltransferase involved in cell wall biosynthesis